MIPVLRNSAGQFRKRNPDPHDSPEEDRPSAPLAAYEAALEELRTLSGQAAQGEAVLEQLGREAAQVARERADALGTEDEEARARALARGEMCAAKKERALALGAQLRAETSAKLSQAMTRFGGLYLVFYNWMFQREKERLAGEMVPGCPQPTLEQAALFLAPVANARALEIGGALDVESFIAKAGRFRRAALASSKSSFLRLRCFFMTMGAGWS